MAVHELAELIIGIDEVGRGALAGPVVVAAAIVLCRNSQIANRSSSLGALKDSKQLSANQRERWYAHFLQHPKIKFAVARVYPREIEKRNISRAANLAARRAYGRLANGAVRNSLSSASAAAFRYNVKIFLDGGLYLGTREWQAANVSNAKTIVKADEKIAAVKIASIVAKVHRDRYMRKLAKRYPAYGFDVHKGYGTAIHRAAIAQHGSCEIHRLTFMANSHKIYR